MMKNLIASILAVLIVLVCTGAYANTGSVDIAIDREARRIVQSMSLTEKVGQKLMLDFRYWCQTQLNPNESCTQDFTEINPTVSAIISQNHIGGIILFSNNIKDIVQVTTLTHTLQQSMSETGNPPLLIGTDQEGGIVGRLPRNVSVSFPGNMALAAAYLGNAGKPYSTKIGNTIAKNLKAVGINVNFAPVVDVNVNSANPVINVRAFSDDPELVARLGEHLSLALQSEGIAATLKHFPGHGDTATDSHVGLPVVNHSLEQAWNIDLYPYKKIIERHPPDLIMTAHIQFPALDNTKIYSAKTGEEIIIPATLSRAIQTSLLRHQLKYQGVVITDAMDMGAIAKNFDPTDATIKSFQAGVDIALMPASVNQPQEAHKIAHLISSIEAAVLQEKISERELNQSVLRIIKLKIKLGLFESDRPALSKKIKRANQVLAEPNQRLLEQAVSNDAITLVQNHRHSLPIKLQPHARIHILTPLSEQGAGIAQEIARLQALQQLPTKLHVSYAKMADTNLEAEKMAIDRADIVIVGNSTTRPLPITMPLSKTGVESIFVQPRGTLVFPDILPGDNEIHGKLNPFSSENQLSEAQFAYQALKYANNKRKIAVFISLLAPYDLPNYARVSDAMLAGYNPYGYLAVGDYGYYRGPSMPALTRVIFGLVAARGKLPVDIPDPGEPNTVVYRRGHGLITQCHASPLLTSGLNDSLMEWKLLSRNFLN